MKREIVHERLLSNDNFYEDMKEAQEGRPYHIPSRRTPLKYADNRYVERNQAFDALRDYIAYGLKQPPKLAGKAAEELSLMAAAQQDDIQRVLKAVESRGILFASLEQMQKFMDLYKELAVLITHFALILPLDLSNGFAHVI